MITQDCITDTQKEIIKTLLYFDVFNYPLNLDEIYQNSSFSESKNKFEIELNSLIQTECIYKFGNFYSTANNIKPNVERRLSGNVLAKKMLSKIINNYQITIVKYTVNINYFSICAIF